MKAHAKTHVHPTYYPPPSARRFAVHDVVVRYLTTKEPHEVRLSAAHARELRDALTKALDATETPPETEEGRR